LKDAKITFERWNVNNGIILDVPQKYYQLREDLLKIFEQTKEFIGQDYPTGKEYLIDFYFGIAMFNLFEEKYSFTLAEKSDNQFWITIGMQIIPDVVFWRWGLNEERFYKTPRRIWLKTIWWYVYLSWQGDKDSTFQALKDNTTDEIVQLVERAGRSGYRVSLYREIIKKYSLYSGSQKARTKSLFRRVMKLNTARVVVVEPSLYKGGENEYVNELFETVVAGQ
jgi:hypothetical protein